VTKVTAGAITKSCGAPFGRKLNSGNAANDIATKALAIGMAGRASMEITMIGLRYWNVMAAAAGAFLVQTLPAHARSNASQAVAGSTEISSAAVPTKGPARGRAEAAQLRRPCMRVASNVPMLFIGVGW